MFLLLIFPFWGCNCHFHRGYPCLFCLQPGVPVSTYVSRKIVLLDLRIHCLEAPTDWQCTLRTANAEVMGVYNSLTKMSPLFPLGLLGIWLPQLQEEKGFSWSLELGPKRNQGCWWHMVRTDGPQKGSWVRMGNLPCLLYFGHKWELDHKEGWVLKNWCLWIVVLEKTLESPLDSKEFKPVNPKGNQSWIFIGRTDAEAEASILWPLDAKSQLIGKDPDAEKDWGQEEKETTEG